MPNQLLRGLAPALILLALPAVAADAPPGQDQAVGQQFHITADSLPQPGATPSANNTSQPVPRGTHQPIVPDGFTLQLVADGLPDPRRLIVRDDGEILVVQQQPGRVTHLTDIDSSGTAHKGTALLRGVPNPYGIASIANGDHKGDLLVADQDAVYSVPAASGDNKVEQLTPAGAFGPAEGHITRSLAVDPKTGELYVGVGSMANLDTGEPAMKATIQKFDADGKNPTTFASGMRNVTGLTFQPGTGVLYAVTMERDGMGDELVPDYFTAVQQGDNFGWPYQYTGGNVQAQFRDAAPKLTAAKLPDVLFEAHSAPLDLAFIPDNWPAQYRGDAVVALHGSWNAGVPRGYKVVIVHFKDGKPDGSYENFMTGFWVSGTSPAEVWGRPAAVAFDRDGSLLVGDDLGNTIWRVIPPKS